MRTFSWPNLLQAVRWHRRGIALLAFFIAVATGLSALLPGQNSGAPLVVAARPLPPGTVLTGADLTVINVAPELVPEGAFTSTDALLGRCMSIGLTRGTPLTTAALGPEGLADHSAGEVLVPFRVRDPDVAALLRLGDRLTIVATTPEGISLTVAEHIRVAQLPAADSGGGFLGSSGASGALIVVAAPRETARQLAAAGDQWLGVIIE